MTNLEHSITVRGGAIVSRDEFADADIVLRKGGLR